MMLFVCYMMKGCVHDVFELCANKSTGLSAKCCLTCVGICVCRSIDLFLDLYVQCCMCCMFLRDKVCMIDMLCMLEIH